MAYYRGYVDVPHGTYDEWRNATLNNFYNYDGNYGCQCMDFAGYLFWANVGFPHYAYYPISSTGNADGVWLRRWDNLAYGGMSYFTLVNNLADVKRGDIICYSIAPFGHIGFADEDYSTWSAAHPGDYEFPILSENNGGTPDPEGGSSVNVHGYDTRYFQGAFRYIPWQSGPTPPTPPTIRQSTFPWLLIVRKLRNRRV